jgi:hypothetical protein
MLASDFNYFLKIFILKIKFLLFFYDFDMLILKIKKKYFNLFSGKRIGYFIIPNIHLESID